MNSIHSFLGPYRFRRIPGAHSLTWLSGLGLASALSACGGVDNSTEFGELSSDLTSARVEAESFQRFYDTDTAHSGNCGTGPVDAEVTSDPAGGGCHVGWTTAGEWLEYDLNVAEGGNHTFTLRLASGQTNRTLHLEVDGVNVSGVISAPASGWQSFADRTVANVPLTTGQHVVRVVFDTGAVNFNYFTVLQTSVTPLPLVSADFSADMGGFDYADQNSGNFADGKQENGRLKMSLGGVDNTQVLDMQGSFHRMFWVSQLQEITLKFDYTLEQSCSYENDESSELLATIDGVPLTSGSNRYIARVVGNGNDCPGVSTSGTFTRKFALNPGKHHLYILGRNNKKTSQDEFTSLYIDNVLITASANQCLPPISQSFSNLCNACDGMLDCQGNCSVTVPSNVGAPCGPCGGVIRCDGTCSEPTSGACGTPPTFAERDAACARDPRVVAGLVSQQVCAGGDVFFRETFNGNGRTCATCHPVTNNYTIDPTFVSTLLASNPNDPLFVAKPGTPLERLETSELIDRAMILENVDGFQDPERRFVSRSVPHLFSLAITMAPDTADGSTTPPVHRTGWGGDGAPGDGSLRSFLDGAIKQHFTKRLVRTPGVDFREANDFERDAVERFQLSLGRQNELDLPAVRFALESAEVGKGRFLDPAQGRCGVCHANAGANFVKSGRNRGFNNGSPPPSVFGSVKIPGTNEYMSLQDGGFGGANLDAPNVITDRGGVLNGFGDNNFSVPPLVEAADTAPFFHSNFTGNSSNTPLGRIAFFYGTAAFKDSQGNQFLETLPEFGPSQIDGLATGGIPNMLAILNAVFNIDIARQRLSAAAKLATDLRQIRSDVQAKLMLLAGEEVEDAMRVLREHDNIHAEEQASLQNVLNQLRLADANKPWSERRTTILSALSTLDTVRSRFGTNFSYQLGEGTLMY